MKKMSTLFEIEYFGKGSKGDIKNIIKEENYWVYSQPNVIATRKRDGTAVAIINGELYKRYDAKQGKIPPAGSIPCCEPDSVTGHHPHWIKVLTEDKSNKYLLDTYYSLQYPLGGGTYEFCGEKVGNNKENVQGHCFFRHGSEILDLKDFSFESIKSYLENPTNDIEGIVFHNLDTNQMCKIRKTDFGVTR